MLQTRGIHWIATTHGSWLHGDPRGSWHDGKLIGPDPFLHRATQNRLREDAVVLSPDEIQLVTAAIGQIAREQNPAIYAAAIQPTHLHLVFGELTQPVEKLIATIKYRTARAVIATRRTANRPAPRSLWTSGRFVRFLFSDAHIVNAIDYVCEHNRRAGLDPQPYEWVRATPTSHPRSPRPEGGAI